MEAKMSSASSSMSYEVQEHSSLLSQLNVNVAALQNQLRSLSNDLVGIKAKQEAIENEQPQFAAASSASNRMLGRIQTKLDDTAAAIAAGANGVGTSAQANERMTLLESEIAKLKTSQKLIQSSIADSTSNYETLVVSMREATTQATTARNNVNKALAEAARASDEVSQVSTTVRMMQNDVGQRDLLLGSLQQQLSSHQVDMNQVKDKLAVLGSPANYDIQLLTMKESITSLRQATHLLQSKLSVVEEEQEELRLKADIKMQKPPSQTAGSAAAILSGQGFGSSPFVAERIAVLEAEVAKMMAAQKSIHTKVNDNSSDYEVLVAAVEEATKMATAARTSASNAMVEAVKAGGEGGNVKMDLSQLETSLKALQTELASIQGDYVQSKAKISQLTLAADSNAMGVQETTNILFQTTASLQSKLKSLEADYEDFREDVRLKLQASATPSVKCDSLTGFE